MGGQADFLAAPPPGVTPNYIDPVSRGYLASIPPLALVTLATLLVALRLYVRRCIVKHLWWDDFCIVIALAFAIARVCIGIYVVHDLKGGRHVWDIPQKELTGTIGNRRKNLGYTADMLYLWGVMFAKTSLLIFYLSLFGVVRWFRWACRAMIAFVIAYCLTFFFIYAFSCTPVARGWNMIGWRGGGSCIDINIVNYTVGGVNIATDLALLLLPIPVVIPLQMNPKKKLGILITFSTGVIVVVAAIVREAVTVTTLQPRDISWRVVPSVMWISIELNVGIICTCLPTYPPLRRTTAVKAVLGAVWPSSVGSDGRGCGSPEMASSAGCGGSEKGAVAPGRLSVPPPARVPLDRIAKKVDVEVTARKMSEDSLV